MDVQEQLLRKARFCLRLGIAPSEYDGLTEEEIQAFLDVAGEGGETNG